MTDREEFEKFLKDNFLYDTSGFIQNEAERKKAQDESFVWRAWQARGELDAAKIKELEVENHALGLIIDNEDKELADKVAELTAKNKELEDKVKAWQEIANRQIDTQSMRNRTSTR